MYPVYAYIYVCVYLCVACIAWGQMTEHSSQSKGEFRETKGLLISK